ncbi:MAG: Holliday junction resolvase RuvX [Candidatus Omnitrophica bacterium]|nr:Holliday junction resolvase RuvX [Candidatus Omnitrophota bacterium]
MRTLGLDLGTKRVGYAVSDEMGILASGRGFIERFSDNELITKIKEIVDIDKIENIVIGMPFNMDGSSGPRVEDTVHLASLIKDKIGIEPILWDERLSTKEAEHALLLADVSRKKRKQVVDKLAAQLILQGYLDSV